jgi:carboxyl-terminal processing protease
MDSKTPENPRRSASQPLVYAALLAVGLFLGFLLDGGGGGPLGRSRGALQEVLDRIESMYVDDVERARLEQVAVEAILAELDPHSYYFSAEELAELAEPMEGGFEGIGIEFVIQDDTLMVVAAIPGGPAARAGMHAGDRIVKVDSVEISGPDLTNARVAELLKGPSGTHVRVGVSRKGRVLQYDLVRDRIPIHSVVAALELEPGIGYIKVVRFAANTAEEFEAGMGKLAAAGVRSVVVDLRGNGGGYLNAVVPMVAGFLEKGDQVVYTEGRHVPRTTYEAEEPGKWRDWNVAVLIDEGSASASEIFAGAIQDNDRGAVIGRRSFGKGLVQEEFGLSDAGALRLTVARFYTPTGRAIQRPYSAGTDAYSEEPGERMENGELFHGATENGPDSLRYETPEGRVVYGGGGIAPDFFVPLDTAGLTDRVAEWMWLGEVRDASFAFVDARRKALEPIRTVAALDAAVRDAAIEDFLRNRSGEQRVVLDAAERRVLGDQLVAQIARNLLGEEALHEAELRGDATLARALEVLRYPAGLAVRAGRLTFTPQKKTP